MTLAHIDTAWFASASRAIVFEILFPLLLAFIISRRLTVGWRYFMYGALVSSSSASSSRHSFNHHQRCAVADYSSWR
jgi:hypothetical protein